MVIWNADVTIKAVRLL